MKLRTSSLFVLGVLLVLLLCCPDSEAVCKNSVINPVTDVNWKGIFPIIIGGVQLKGTDIDTPREDIGSPVCVCGVKLGIKVSFWEPARLIETVKDPYCFTTIGVSFSNPSGGFLGGSSKAKASGDRTTARAFQQTHYYIFPVWAILDMFLDLLCHTDSGFDIAYISEIDPTHNNDLLAFFLNPEALLLGNPVSQLTCVVDAVAANAKIHLDPLFWCVGSWGSVYPLSGTVSKEDYVEANALIASRMIFKMGRIMALRDPAVNYCGSTITPIWIKSHYRMHLVKPVKDSMVHPLGRSSLVWGHYKNPPYGTSKNSSDNFLWLLFRKQKCCVFLYP